MNNDVVTRLFINSDWRDVSSDVKYSDRIKMDVGKSPEDDKTPPQESKFTLLDHDGDYNPRDPLGQWYGYLGLNTPCEQSQRIAKDTCTATASNSWGTTEAHAHGAYSALTWTSAAGVAGDFNKASGKATHLISAANDSRYSWLADVSLRDVDFLSTMSLGFTNVTGGVLGADFFVRGTGSITNYYATRVLIQTDETITIDITDVNGVSLTSGAVTVSGLLHTANAPLRIRVQTEGQNIRAKIWGATAAEPYAWHRTVSDNGSTASTEDLRDAPGFVGVRSIVGSGNTNVPVTFTYDDFEVKVPLFFGEISEWPPARDVSGEDRTVPVVASGIKRRLGQRKSPALSAPRRFIPTDPECTYYWPLEDGPLAITAEPLVGDVPLLSLSLGTGSNSAFGSGDLAPWLPQGCIVKNEVLGVNAYSLDQPDFTAANGWRVEYYRQARDVDDAGDSFYVSDNDDGLWLMTINHATGDVSILSPYSTVTTTYEPLTSGEGAWIQLYVFGSGTVFWSLYMNNELVLSSSAAGNAHAVRQLVFTGGERGLAIGQIAVYHGTTPPSAPEAMMGHTGENALWRLLRLTEENSISLSYLGAANSTPTMGPQGMKPLLELFEEAVTVDAGIFYEPKGLAGLAYIALHEMYNRTSWATIDMSDHELSPPWQPTDDDRLTVNEVHAERLYGGTYVYRKETGTKSILPPESGGVGVYDDKVVVNVDSDGALPDQAGWRVGLGTVDERRYPNVYVKLHREQIRTDNPTLYSRLLSLSVGDQITLTGLQSTGIYDDADQIVVGYEREIDQFRHDLILHCTPASAYTVLELDTGAASLDSGSSVLNEDLDTTETGVEVANGATDLWATTATNPGEFPFDIIIGGERMTVTACVGATSPQTLTVTRSVNGVVKTHTTGAEVHVFTPFLIAL